MEDITIQTPTGNIFFSSNRALQYTGLSEERVKRNREVLVSIGNIKDTKVKEMKEEPTQNTLESYHIGSLQI